VKFGRREIGKIVLYLPDRKKIASLSSFRFCADRAQNLPDNVFRFQSAPDFIQIGSLSAQLYPNAEA